MRILVQRFLILGVLISASVNAFAGARDGGGGVGFLCQSGRKTRVYLADTYQLVKKGQLPSNKTMKDGLLFLAAGRRFANSRIVGRDFKDFLSAGWSLISIESSLTWKPKRGMDLLGDDHIAESDVPAGCKKIQLAIQDIQSRTVYFDDQLVHQLTSAEVELLRLHETLISVRRLPGEDTTAIREAVNSVVDASGYAKFVASILDPNVLTPIQTHLEPYEKLIAALPGRYIGRDPLNQPCELSVVRHKTVLSFQITTKAGQLTSKSIPLNQIAQKLAADTQFRREQDKNFDAERLSVNYYTYQGLVSLFGTYPSTSSIGIDWYKGTLSSVIMETSLSTGPFRNPLQSSNLTCLTPVRAH